MKTRTQTTSFYDLRDTLTQPGCPVCRLKADSTDRFLDSLLWESVNDPDRRQKIRQARGFCHKHTWRLVRPGASLGVAIITRDVLQSVLEAIGSATFRALSFWSLRRAHEAISLKQPTTATAELVAQLEPQTRCTACAWAEKMEGIYLMTLLSNLLGEDDLLAAYEASDGLCLPHFRQALILVRSKNIFG